jgi:nitronate monooxygenase
MSQPRIIQGGMGVAVSGWPLARAVSVAGQLGVVSGTALAVVLARRLQLGDPGGELRRALASFPLPQMAQRVLADHFIPGGKAPGTPFKLTPMPTLQPRPTLVELTVVSNFVEVFLAKEGHPGLVGINYLEKIQLPTLPSLFGAMLAGVDYVLMGAGIPRAIPGALDLLARGETTQLPIDVEGSIPGEKQFFTFSPRSFFGGTAPQLKRPQFLGIVASATLAMTLARKSSGRVDGFIVEGPTAGGHNAPPRGPSSSIVPASRSMARATCPSSRKSAPWDCPSGWPAPMAAPANSPKPCALGRRRAGGYRVCLLRRVRRSTRAQTASPPPKPPRPGRVFTDPLASPAGFPFKVAQMAQTLSEASLYENRPRICDLGYLRHPYRKTDGTVGYRCPAEPLPISSAKAARWRKRTAANASATASPPRSASARSGPNPEPSCRWSPPVTTWLTSPNS